MSKQQLKTFIFLSNQTVTAATTNHGFTENIVNLHAAIEGIRAEDGISINVRSFRMHVRAYMAAEDRPCILVPVAVQTAGTWTSTVSLANSTSVDFKLDASIDDVFGYDQLRPAIATKLVPSGTVARQQGWETTILLPPKLLQLLNKESESERLQTLYMGLVGEMLSDGDVLIMDILSEIQYSEHRKKIVIR